MQQQPVKPGVYTSELYVTAGTIISAVTVAIAAQGTAEKIAAWMTAAGAVMAYLYSRYSLKTATVGAEVPAPLVQVPRPLSVAGKLVPAPGSDGTMPPPGSDILPMKAP